MIKHTMNQLKPRIIVLVLGVLLTSNVLSTQGAPAGKSGEAGLVVSISDIHFNPFYDPKLVASLVQSDYTKWPAIFSGSGIQGYGAHGADTNYNLFNSALENIHLQAPRPDFIVISGDFLAHDFQETYTKLAGSSDPRAVNSFIDKTIAFVAWMISRRFPKTPVFPALGNNDSYCGDYQLEPGGRFLSATAAAWKGLLRSVSNIDSFMQTFPTSGSYSVVAPNNKNHRIIVLNATFFSNNYKNTCGDPGAQPGKAEMTWLESELKKAAAAREHVWLVYHIPAGVDVFASVKNGPAEPAILLWQPALNQQFIDLVTRNSSVIVAAFAGHIHMDSFQLVQSNNQAPASFVHITPAISPMFGNNPAFDVFTYNRRLASLKDYSAYYLDLSSAASQKNTPVRWSKEYSFVQAYAQPNFSAATLQAVYRRMPANQTDDLTKYEKYYDVSNTTSPGFAANNWRAYWCGLGNLTVETYSSCLASTTSRRGVMRRNQGLRGSD